MSFNFMAEVTVCSDFGDQENKICHCFHFPLLYLRWVNPGLELHHFMLPQCWVPELRFQLLGPGSGAAVTTIPFLKSGLGLGQAGSWVSGSESRSTVPWGPMCFLFSFLLPLLCGPPIPQFVSEVSPSSQTRLSVPTVQFGSVTS